MYSLLKLANRNSHGRENYMYYILKVESAGLKGPYRYIQTKYVFGQTTTDKIGCQKVLLGTRYFYTLYVTKVLTFCPAKEKQGNWHFLC